MQSPIICRHFWQTSRGTQTYHVRRYFLPFNRVDCSITWDIYNFYVLRKVCLKCLLSMGSTLTCHIVAIFSLSLFRFGEVQSLRRLTEKFCSFINFKTAAQASTAMHRLQVRDLLSKSGNFCGSKFSQLHKCFFVCFVYSIHSHVVIFLPCEFCVNISIFAVYCISLLRGGEWRSCVIYKTEC